MKGEIEKSIEEVLKEMGIAHDFMVEHPADLSHGDYATNVAMIVCALYVLNRKAGDKDPEWVTVEFEGKATNPRLVAEFLQNKLDGKIPHVASISVAGPGFINFHLDRNFFKEKIAEITTHPESWGHNHSFDGKKIIVEYTDPNPFKEFHIGHLFTNSVGESIARLFMMSGAEVKRVNYQGDVGLHVAHALYGMQQLGFAEDNSFTARDLGRAYAYGATAYKESEEAQKEIREINKKVYERSDATINTRYDKGREVSLAYFETIYEMLDTKFDAYFFESVAGPRGKELVLSNPEVFVQSDGAYIFDGEKQGLHTRVFLNKEGLPTYEAKELALAKMKEEELGVYDLSVVSTSNEINEYFKVLKKAMSFVFPELEKKTEHIGHGTVKLTTGKMSSRTGDVIPAIDFIEELSDATASKMDTGGAVAPDETLARDIAIGAIKYATLKGNILQDSVFDKERALDLEGDSGPYLMYTHARIASLENKAEEAGVRASVAHAPEKPYEVEKLIYQFPEIIEKAQRERAPHHVVVFLTQLASAFNTFYAHEKIADPNDEFAPYKLALSKAVRITLKNGLWVLGVKAPQSM